MPDGPYSFANIELKLIIIVSAVEISHGFASIELKLIIVSAAKTLRGFVELKLKLIIVSAAKI